MIENNEFEDGSDTTGCYEPFGANDGAVEWVAENPLAGMYSLGVTVIGHGRVACEGPWGYHEGPIARTVTAEADIRVEAPTSGSQHLLVCAVVYFEDTVVDTPNMERTCRQLTPADQGVVHLELVHDTRDKRLARVFFWFEGVGTTFSVTLDDAHLWVDQVPGSDGPRGAGGGGGGGGGSCLRDAVAPSGPPDPEESCFANTTPRAGAGGYTPTAVNLPAARPFISLADYRAIAASNPIFTRYKNNIDSRINGGNAEAGASEAVIMYARTGDVRYIDWAIGEVDEHVADEETRIAAGERTAVESDSYLHIGHYVEELALTYDYGFDRLTPEQRQRWLAYGEQAVSNIWSPHTAKWGDEEPGRSSWSAWSINNPGNNYFFSFMKATQSWALATRSQPWIDFLQGYKFPLIESYYGQFVGGGSREGTGYGAAQRDLWENVRMWRTSTGEALPNVRDHARASVDYWVHATVPTLNFYAPFGDLSRDSNPSLYDYHENLVREAAMAAPGTEQANRALWWLANNSVPDTLQHARNLRPALLVPAGAATPPTALSYHARGVGHFFSRSDWTRDATWLQFAAGPYDESHAHHDQGGFSFYRRGWRSVTSNIWSLSGLEGNPSEGDKLHDDAHNILRFERPPATAGGPPRLVEQYYSESSMTTQTEANGLVRVRADLTPAYEFRGNAIVNWRRELELQGSRLRVLDTCQVASDVRPVFQLHVPVQPVNNGNGSISAGPLQIATDPSMEVSFFDLTSIIRFRPDENGDPEPFNPFHSGWRIDLRDPAGCAFDVRLTATG